ncbi:unnamed protein product [Clavelina lepadiformis]|uniref:WD repeat domain phosphoinositide-interacting protein 4 n=1 Tax=Clavelina lepadiformis TaxID=159417 RepID=A0ABP0G3F3_CLALP
MESNVNNISFNQDKSCFTASMDDGMRLYNAEPLAEKTRLDVDQVGSVCKVAMLYRTNLLAVIFGGKHPKYSSNIVQIWDDRIKSFVLKYVLPDKVLNVHLCQDKIVIVLRTKVYVFTFPNNSKLMFQVDTRENPLGICQVSPSSGKNLLAVLGHNVGSLQLIHLSKVGENKSSSPITISAHQADIACMAVNNQGSIIATASEKGTLIRLFATQNCQKLMELRRGTDQAILHCINFSKDSSFLCAASDKGTVHVFALRDTTLNRRSAFAKAGQVSPFQQYTSSQWSFCNFTVPAECPCMCAFGPGKSVIAVCIDGTFHKYVFTEEGACSREGYDVYLNLEDENDF